MGYKKVVSKMDYMKIYNKLPILGQNVACSIEGNRLKTLRWGGYFRERLEFYKKSDSWSAEQVSEYQDEKLKELVVHAYETVPYYKKLFGDYGFDPYTFKHSDELRKLPILTKDIVQENYKDFISTADLDSKTHIHRTGGTTGKSMLIYETWHDQADQWAVCWRYREKVGIPFGTWGGEFASKLVVPQSQVKPPYWRWDRAEHRLFFSPFHLDDSTVLDYAEGLKNVKWIHGYTSKLVDLANRLMEKGIYVPMEHVTIGAENLYETQKNILEKTFSCKVYQHYAMTEAAANISQQPDGTLRVDEDFCFLEFIDDERGSAIIGTNLMRKRMPLIRYKTGDYAKVTDRKAGGFRVVDSFEGREFEYLYKGDGKTITGVEIDEEVISKVEHIAEAQLLQKKDHSIEVRIHRAEGYDEGDEKLLQSKLSEVLYGDQISIKYVDKIESEKNGKRKLILKE